MGHLGYALVSIVPTRSSYSYFLHTIVNPSYSKRLLNVLYIARGCTFHTWWSWFIVSLSSTRIVLHVQPSREPMNSLEVVEQRLYFHRLFWPYRCFCSVLYCSSAVLRSFPASSSSSSLCRVSLSNSYKAHENCESWKALRELHIPQHYSILICYYYLRLLQYWLLEGCPVSVIHFATYFG